METVKNFLLVAAGGAAGAALRYGACLVMAARFPGFPAGTLTVNALGSFLIGLLAVALQNSHEGWRLLLIVGVLGGFTTFSSFSHETMVLFNDGRILHAGLNVLLNVVLCLLFVYAGFKTGKVIFDII